MMMMIIIVIIIVIAIIIKETTVGDVKQGNQFHSVISCPSVWYAPLGTLIYSPIPMGAIKSVNDNSVAYSSL